MPADMTKWNRVVALVRENFGEGLLAEETTCQAVVLIPKGKGYYRGIGLVEEMWKVVADILNYWLTASVTYHDSLHGFQAGRGTGTATLKSKIFQ